MTTNICWIANKGGTWSTEGEWSGGSYFPGRTIATVPVPAGTTHYRDIAEDLLKALTAWSGAWTEDGTWCFTDGGRTVVKIVIHAAELTVDATWRAGAEFRGMDGVDVSDMVRGVESAVRQ